jgi:hypothetical protein
MRCFQRQRLLYVLFIADRRSALNAPSKSDLVWDPAVVKNFSEDEGKM